MNEFNQTVILAKNQGDLYLFLIAAWVTFSTWKQLGNVLLDQEEF